MPEKAVEGARKAGAEVEEVFDPEQVTSCMTLYQVSGTGAVAYLLKCLGKRVTAADAADLS
mgnify:CR=1 FL=1